jgi:hypothetical protein
MSSPLLNRTALTQQHEREKQRQSWVARGRGRWGGGERVLTSGVPPKVASVLPKLNWYRLGA